MSHTVHIAMASDANHLAYLPGVWRSLVRNASAEIALHLLVRGLPSDQERRLQDVAAEEGLRLTLTATDNLLEGLDVKTPHYITRVSLDRLFLPRLLPELGRLVYLDTDILVLGDVRELETHPTGPTGLAAKATIHPRFQSFREALRSWDPQAFERISRDTTEDWPFFNSGVLVMDLERLRATQFTERALEYIAQYQCNDSLTASLCVQGLRDPDGRARTMSSPHPWSPRRANARATDSPPASFATAARTSRPCVTANWSVASSFGYSWPKSHMSSQVHRDTGRFACPKAHCGSSLRRMTTKCEQRLVPVGTRRYSCFAVTGSPRLTRPGFSIWMEQRPPV